MARKADPWYWQDRNGWYVTVNGQRHFLGEHPPDAPKPKKGKQGWNAPKEIDAAFRQLMGTEAPPCDTDAVINILDDFIVWTFEHRAQRTAERYKEFCDRFVKAHGRVSVGRLTSKHVSDWLAGQTTWNATSKNHAITVLIRGFNWAKKNRGLKVNPIEGMEKPPIKLSKIIVTPEEFRNALAATKDTAFKDLLMVCYDAGLRPKELKKLEAHHLQLDKQRAVIPADEAKGGITRTIYFPTDESMEIVRRLAEKNRVGPLFLNLRGRPWTASSVKLRFKRMEGKVGRRLRQYQMRKSFITRKIISGVDSHVVAKLAGHQSTDMIDRHYSAVADDHGYLLSQAKRDVGINPATNTEGASREKQ